MYTYFIWIFFRTLAVNIFFKKSFELNRHLDLIVASAILGWTPLLHDCMYLTSFRWYILLFFLFSIVNFKLYLCNSEFSWIFVDIGFHKKSPDPWWIKTSNQEIWATRCYQFCIDLFYHGSIAKGFTEQGEFTFFMVDCADLVTFPNPTKTWFL